MEEKGYTKIAIISLLMAVAILIVALIYLFKPIFPGFPKPSPGLPPKTPVQEEWRVYQNSKYGLAVSYPDNWKASGKPTSDEYLSLISEYGTEELVVAVHSGKQGSLADFISYLNEVRLTSYEGRPSVTVLKEETVKTKEFEAVHRQILMNAAGFPAIETYILKDGRIYSLTLNLYRNEGSSIEEKYLKLHQQIFSTFKFFEL